MADMLLRSFMQNLRQSVNNGTALNCSDAELLTRYRCNDDHAAFEAIVVRHGPMVMGVCQRALNDVHAAEDAFQATFLVLARSSHSLRKENSLASWLHGVAHRTALKARAKTAVRQRHEQTQWSNSSRVSASPETVLEDGDLKKVIDAELSRIPSKYREPMVLCYLEGKTQQEVAQFLGWPTGTVATRISRGREMLRSKLLSRGITTSSAALIAFLAQQNLSMALSPSSISTVCHFARLVLAGKFNGIPTSVQVLFQKVIKTMFCAKIVRHFLVVCTFVFLGGMAIYWQQSQAREPKVNSPIGVEAQNQKAKPKNKGIQGHWMVQSVEFGGTNLPKNLLKGYNLKFDKTNLTWDAATGLMSQGGKITAIEGTYECTFKTDPATNPHEIDIQMKTKRKTIMLRGIYEVDGDTMKLCFGSGGRRPAEFTSEARPTVGCFILKRQSQ